MGYDTSHCSSSSRLLQSRVMFRAKGEGHGWSLLFLLFSSSSSIIKLLYRILGGGGICSFCLLFFFSSSLYSEFHLKTKEGRKRRMKGGPKEFTARGRGQPSSLVLTSLLLLLLFSFQFKEQRGGDEGCRPHTSFILFLLLLFKALQRRIRKARGG